MQMDEIRPELPYEAANESIRIRVEQELSALLNDSVAMFDRDEVPFIRFRRSTRPVREGEHLMAFILVDRALMMHDGLSATNESDVISTHQNAERTGLHLKTRTSSG
jgi:hypothetical protein